MQSEINIIIHFGVSVVIFVGRRCTVASSRRGAAAALSTEQANSKAILRPYSPPRLFDVCDHFYAMLVRWLLPYTARNLSLQNSKITMYLFGIFKCTGKSLLEADLILLHQLTHNMTKDCSLICQFNTWKLQAQNILCTQIVFCFLTFRTIYVHNMFWACSFYVLNW